MTFRDAGGTGSISVALVDDEVLVRLGIRGVLEKAADIEVIAEASDGGGALDLLKACRPRVLLIDDLASVRLLRQTSPVTEVIALGGSAAREDVFRALRAGAAGFVVKNGDPCELIHAVRAVAAGGAVLPAGCTRSLVDHFNSDHVQRMEQARDWIGQLTSREKEVLVGIAQGKGNSAIARTMYLSEGAVKSYVSRLLTKLHCDNRVQAAFVAYHAGLVTELCL